MDWSFFEKYTTRVIAEKAAKVIEDHSSPTKSLFLYVPHLAVHSANPHSPLQAPPETVALFSHITDKSRRQYAGWYIEIEHYSELTQLNSTNLNEKPRMLGQRRVALV